MGEESLNSRGGAGTVAAAPRCENQHTDACMGCYGCLHALQSTPSVLDRAHGTCSLLGITCKRPSLLPGMQQGAHMDARPPAQLAINAPVQRKG